MKALAPVEIVEYAQSQFEAFRSVMTAPGIREHFDMNGTPEEQLAIPHRSASATLLARRNGEPVGFVLSILVTSEREGTWAMLRLGVVESARRQGVGAALLREAERRLTNEHRDARHIELRTSAYVPNDAATALAARHGFTHARYFWTMERRPAPPAEIVWPRGIEVRVFDGGDQAFDDWSAAYNASFAENYGFFVATPDDCRALASSAAFPPDGLLLAYRDGRCVGFCRNALHVHADPPIGEVDILGVAPEARGIGLGRALLRWGVAWLLAQDAPHVTLMVDGENATAVRLYEQEGFAITRTRQVWARRSP
jgi:mycothiol synthase